MVLRVVYNIILASSAQTATFECYTSNVFLARAKVMDSAQMFSMIFGSDKFEPLVGELRMVAQVRAADLDQSKLAGFDV